MLSIGIVGGGPGGLMTAWFLKHKLAELSEVTVFEASDRLGGKIMTRRFDSAPVIYEAGVAEIYDYSMTGPDPLRSLITEVCGLAITPMDSEAVALDGVLHNRLAELAGRYGRDAVREIETFREQCQRMLSPIAYYEGSGKDDNDHPWAGISASTLLDREVKDALARRYLRVMSRSDIASELHLTNGLNALKNFLMDVDGYIDLYSIDGGIERLIDKLATLHDAKVALGRRVNAVSRGDDGRYVLDVAHGMEREQHVFDLVFFCLPHNWLSTVDYRGEKLGRAMADHIAYFDRPAHYLRIAALFRTPFWADALDGAWFMSEAFGGCCVYDEGARHDAKGHGVLNWLVAGSDVLAWGNLTPDELIGQAIASLPDDLREQARAQLIEVRVHHHLASVNALPGGMPVRDPKRNHVPEPVEHPGLFVTGDYLFDSTLNGLLDSADFASDLAFSHVMQLRYDSGEAHQAALRLDGGLRLSPPSRKIDRVFFDNYRGLGSYAETWRSFADPDYLADCFRMAFGLGQGAKVLVAGSASGLLVGALRERGFDAWGVENNAFIHARTPDALKPFNRLGSVLDLPFEDDRFDLVFETCLCHVSERRLGSAMDELWRVGRNGLMIGSVTNDPPSEVLDRYDLLRGVKRLASTWEWSEDLINAGFDYAVQEAASLKALWTRTVAAGRGPGRWYENEEALRYCFLRKVAEETAFASLKTGAI
jgi:monoamine oxidase/SAM-dependent methyltransferase